VLVLQTFVVSCVKIHVLSKITYLFVCLFVVCLLRYLSRPGDSEVTFSVFESRCHLYYHSNH